VVKKHLKVGDTFNGLGQLFSLQAICFNELIKTAQLLVGQLSECRAIHLSLSRRCSLKNFKFRPAMGESSGEDRG
jgi:hypothetical protein